MTFRAEQYRPLGTTTIRLSPLGLGTVKFGRNTNVKYPASFDIPDDASLRNLLAVASDCGINLIDTAPAYGSSEERLGQLLGDIGRRWVICTKVGEFYENDTSRWDFSAAATTRSVERSLARLGTDCIDIVLVHSDGNDEAVINESGALEALAKLKDRGDIRCFGVSTKTVGGGLLAVDTTDVVMVAYNVEDQSQVPVLEAARDRNKGVLIKKALSSGHTDSPGEALRYALAAPAVTSVIVGTIDASHLEDNVRKVCEDL